MDFQSKLKEIYYIYMYIRTYQSKISRDSRIVFNALYLDHNLIDVGHISNEMGEGPSLFFAITKLKQK